MADDRTYGGYASDGRPDYTGNESGRSDYRSSSARDYAAAGQNDREGSTRTGYSGQEYDRASGERGRGGNDGRGYGEGGFGSRYEQSSVGRGQGQGGGAYGDYGQSDAGAGQRYGARDRSYDSGTGEPARGVGQGRGQNAASQQGNPAGDPQRDWNGDYQRGNFRQQGSSWDRGGGRNQSHAEGGQRTSRGDQDDRTFFDRAGDEVRSWFGDDEAQRRREQDEREDQRRTERYGGGQRQGAGALFSGHRDDHDYHHWRQQQIDALDRDYHEYREENRQRFHHEFGAWRTERQGQRDALKGVEEHMEVVGQDGVHVGTVDKVRNDRVILTKSDRDAGGRHHSFPSRWIGRVEDGRVVLRKTADEAKSHWRDEERSGGLFGEEQSRSSGAGAAAATADPAGSATAATGTREATGGSMAQTAAPPTANGDADEGSANLNRSFSGTY